MASISSITISSPSEGRPKVAAPRDLVSVIIPCYNEGERINHNLHECLLTLKLIGLPFEIIAVNDGSSDDTFQEITRLAITNPEIIPVTYSRNAGKGYALRMGALKARGDLIVFMDADLEIHPKHATLFIQEMRSTGADMVIGSKRHPRSVVDYPKKRQMLSWGYHILVRVLFGLRLSDTQPGFKLLRREVLEEELGKVKANRYAFDLELLVNAYADGFKIVEAPIELNFSRAFGGRIGYRSVNHIFKETMGIFVRYRANKAHSKGKKATSKVSLDKDLP